MSTNDEDYRELLKMKQGLIEKSEIIPENETRKPSELNSFQRVENFFYYYKWVILIVLCAAALLAFLILQTVFREKEDLRVLLIATEQGSELSARADYIKEVIERHCPDFDENGSVVVNVIFIDLAAGEETGEYFLAQSNRYSTEIHDGIARMIITDEGIAEYFSDENGFQRDAFIDFSGDYSDKELFENCGIPIGYTDLAEGWQSCPENVFVFVRQGGDSQKTEQKERAEAVLKSMLG